MALQIPPNCDLTLGLTCVEKDVPGRSVWRARADERFANPVGVIQGGFLGAICDSAMGASAVTAAGDRKVSVANTEMKVTFLRAVHVGDELTCVATALKAGRSISFLEAKIMNQREEVVVVASSTYLLKER